MMDYDVAIDSSQSFGRQGLNALGHSKHDKVKTCQQRKWSPQTAHVMAGNETTYQRNQAPGQFLIFLISSLTLGPLGPLALHGTTWHSFVSCEVLQTLQTESMFFLAPDCPRRVDSSSSSSRHGIPGTN